MICGDWEVFVNDFQAFVTGFKGKKLQQIFLWEFLGAAFWLG